MTGPLVGWPAYRARQVAAADVAEFADSSGGTPGNTIASLANERWVIPQFYTLLTSLDTPANIATWVAPFDGAIISWQMVDRVVATSGGAGDADIDLLINDVAVTGAIATIVVTDFDTIGKRKAGGTITALNTFVAGDTIKVTCTESTTNFTAGAIDIYLGMVCRNVALDDAVSSLATKVNSIINNMQAAGQMLGT